MKIGFLGPAEPFRGGIAQFLHNMADELSEKEEIIVFTFIKQYPKLFFPGKEQTEKTEKNHNYPILRIVTPYNLLTWKKAAKSIAQHGINHLIIKYWIPFFCPCYTFIIKYLKKHTNIKIHILCHNLEYHEKWFFSEVLLKKMVLKSDSIIVLSDNVLGSWKKLNINNIKIIKLFHPLYKIDSEKPSKNSSLKIILPTETVKLKQETEISAIEKRRCVLFIGFIKYYKGLDIFLKSIPLVSERLSDIQFIIAGEVYGSFQKYDEIIKTFGSKYNIIFNKKYVTIEEIPHYFSIADVVIVPYRSATQSGIIQLAYSFKKPVIASDILGLREMVLENRTGLLFEKENYQDLAEKIIRFFQLFENKDFTDEINEYNKQFTWEKFTNDLLFSLNSF
ncbi:MAG: glycosyltransferase [Candidatus Cloacimonetes bacterium]|nr:glycosyltransferase [Candidatus Cloacimonadota bacterium]